MILLVENFCKYINIAIPCATSSRIMRMIATTSGSIVRKFNGYYHKYEELGSQGTVHATPSYQCNYYIVALFVT